MNITSESDDKDERFYSDKFDQQEIRSRIRLAFFPRRELRIHEEVVPCKASLLQIEKFTSPVEANDDRMYYPKQSTVSEIIQCDECDDKPLTPEARAAIELLKKQGIKIEGAENLHPERKQTYHYLPYRFDSSLEQNYFLKSVLPVIAGKNLEFYFNGDDTLTEFKINCYKKYRNKWQYIGKYVPDFLLLQRNAEGEIKRIIIIETKGEGFVAKFADCKQFIQQEFITKNNERFGYERFHYLYLEDTMSEQERTQRTLDAINNFFHE